MVAFRNKLEFIDPHILKKHRNLYFFVPSDEVDSGGEYDWRTKRHDLQVITWGN